MNGKSLRCNLASLEEASVNALYPSKKSGDHKGLGLKSTCSAAYHVECKTVNDNVKKHLVSLFRLYRRLLKYTSLKLYICDILIAKSNAHFSISPRLYLRHVVEPVGSDHDNR